MWDNYSLISIYAIISGNYINKNKSNNGWNRGILFLVEANILARK